MPLQNRVTPWGEIVADPARGTFFGNRGGRIHAPDKTLTGRRWASRAWICCVLRFKGRRRRVMAPNGYTELFFLDEVTALAAGHRPCFECRRREAVLFLEAHAAARGSECRPSAPEFDRLLHGSRLDGKAKRLDPGSIDDLPDGAMIEWNDAAWTVCGRRILKWSFSGYSDCRARPSGQTVRIITPHPVVEALRMGYKPVFHPSADRFARA